MASFVLNTGTTDLRINNAENNITLLTLTENGEFTIRNSDNRITFIFNTSGAITTGLWQGTTVATGFGGTGLTTFTAAGRIIYSSSASALDVLTIGATNDVLQVVAGIPAWVTNPTFGNITSGAITSSGNVLIAKINPLVDIQETGSSSPFLRFLPPAGVGEHFTIQTDAPPFTRLSFYRINAGIGTEMMNFNRSTGAATFAGTITSGAPLGGSGAWKLGVANTVSPTAPNRTITVDIGGTTYYIAAKTTND